MARPLARCRRSSSSPGVHGLWPGADALPSRHPPSVLYAIVKTAQIQHAAATVAQAQIQDAAATMSSSATKIAVSCRWGEAGCGTMFDGQGQNHVTVSSKARIEANIHRGNITIATAPVPTTRNRVRRLPLAEAPYGDGASDEGPSDGPPRRPDVPPRRRPDGPPQRRQRTLHSFMSSSPATSTRSDISTMPEREEIDLRDVDGEILIAERVFDRDL